MKCEECIALLNEYADGELSPELTAELEEHLSKCEKCRSYLDDICLIKTEIADTDQPVPEELHSNIMNVVNAERNKKIVKFPIFRSKYIGWAIAACFMVVIASSFIPGLFSINEMINYESMTSSSRDGAAYKDMAEKISDESMDAPASMPEIPNSSGTEIVPEEPGISNPDNFESTDIVYDENVKLVFVGNGKLPETIGAYKAEYNGNEVYVYFEYSDKAIDFAEVLKLNGFTVGDSAKLSKDAQKALLKTENVIVIVIE